MRPQWPAEVLHLHWLVHVLGELGGQASKIQFASLHSYVVVPPGRPRAQKLPTFPEGDRLQSEKKPKCQKNLGLVIFFKIFNHPRWALAPASEQRVRGPGAGRCFQGPGVVCERTPACCCARGGFLVRAIDRRDRVCLFSRGGRVCPLSAGPSAGVNTRCRVRFASSACGRGVHGSPCALASRPVYLDALSG